MYREGRETQLIIMNRWQALLLFLSSLALGMGHDTIYVILYSALSKRKKRLLSHQIGIRKTKEASIRKTRNKNLISFLEIPSLILLWIKPVRDPFRNLTSVCSQYALLPPWVASQARGVLRSWQSLFCFVLRKMASLRFILYRIVFVGRLWSVSSELKGLLSQSNGELYRWIEGRRASSPFFLLFKHLLIFLFIFAALPYCIEASSASRRTQWLGWPLCSTFVNNCILIRPM